MMSGNHGYGVHPTVYGSLSDAELYSLYRESSWFAMGESERQQLLQETVNRSAAAKGELGACEVRFADLDSRTLGQQSGNVIEVNRDALAKDLHTHDFNGRLIQEKVVDSNMQALETVLHEDIHAWQNQCIDGTIQCPDPSLLAEYEANNFTVSLVSDGNGGLQPGSQYLNGMTDGIGYYMYYFQSTERDAHLYSEMQTRQIMNDLAQKYGEDKSLLTYQKSVLLNGYQAEYQKGQALFGNNSFDKEINQVLVNQYYGIHTAVDPKIEAAVQKEMADSYQNQLRSSLEQKGQESIEKGYTPVTAEDGVQAHGEPAPQIDQAAGIPFNTMGDDLQTTQETGAFVPMDDPGEAPSNGIDSSIGDDDGGIRDDDGGIGDDDGGIGDDDGGLE